MSAVRFLVAIILAVLDLRCIFLIAGRVGWTGTLAWLLLAFLLGLSLLGASRRELARLPRWGDLDRRGGETLARAAGFGIAGVLLMIPGLLTDILGILVLVPGVRRGILRGLLRIPFLDPFDSRTYGDRPGARGRNGAPGGGGPRSEPFGGEVRDVEFEVVEGAPPEPREAEKKGGDGIS